MRFLKVTKEQYAEFMKHYAWVLLQSPDYRLGQAFINYFPEIRREILRDSNGTLDEFNLFYESDNNNAQRLIDLYIEL